MNWHLRFKYLSDRVVGFLLLILLFPMLAVVSLCIFLDDGRPVFFRQERAGWKKKRFEIFKFRTMVVGADDLLSGKNAPFGVRRVTRVGAFLRRTSLDELPQLLNIAAGSMSIVGPRPVLPEHLDRYSIEQLRRFRMKPGVTGLAQIKGRNTLRWSRRIRYDNWYIDHYTVGLDLWVLARTVRVVFRRDGVVLDRNPEQVDDLGEPKACPRESDSGVIQ